MSFFAESAGDPPSPVAPGKGEGRSEGMLLSLAPMGGLYVSSLVGLAYSGGLVWWWTSFGMAAVFLFWGPLLSRTPQFCFDHITQDFRELLRLHKRSRRC